MESSPELGAGGVKCIGYSEDGDLVRRTIEGDNGSFNILVGRYRAKVIHLIISTLGPYSEYEDIAQDVFMKLYLSLSRYRGDASFSTYLYTITVNRCRDEVRKRRIRKFLSFDEWFSGNNEQAIHVDMRERLEENERVAIVKAAMQTLPTQTQMILHLREIEELSYKELSDIFNVEVGTIKSRLARARDKLREVLLPYMLNGDAIVKKN